MYYTQEQIDRANQADLVLFLQSQGKLLERDVQEYKKQAAQQPKDKQKEQKKDLEV